MTRKDDLIEALAAVEHECWGDWQRYMHECAFRDPLTRQLIVKSAEQVDHWERQIATPYAALSEREKQSDREQVLRYWPVLIDFVAEWIVDWLGSEEGSVLAGQWREDMT